MQADWQIRRMTQADLPDALALQVECYPPDLHEGLHAFESRLAQGPKTCLVAVAEDRVVAYLISHPWARGAPPPLDQALPAGVGAADCWFVQDLSVLPAFRGRGLGEILFEAGREAALSLALPYSELIAVGGAEVFWSRLGYRPAATGPDLARKVAGYGPTAIFMAQNLRRPGLPES